ncbi:MAG: ATP-binding protein [Acidimicrobiales bacterium]
MDLPDDGHDHDWWGEPVWQIMANPGATVAPQEVVGRESVVAEVVDSAIGRGALLFGDRRMGKTAVLGPVMALLEGGPFVVLQVGGETGRPEVLEARLADALRRHARFRSELAAWDIEVDLMRGPFKLRRSRQRAEATQDDLFRWAAKASEPDRLVLVMDEVTEAAKAFASTPVGSAGFLHELRNARETLPNVSMIFSGSVGLHHVVRDMGPVNDLRAVRVGPLAFDDACYLARCLLAGTPGVSVPPTLERPVCEALAEATNGIAFYLHHLVHDLGRHRAAATPELVADLLTAAIESPEDPWHLGHYRDRLESYYGADAPLLELILDEYAASGATGIDPMLHHLRTIGEERDRAGLVRLVELLERDYYLRRSSDGTDEFDSSLIRRYWRHLRRLGDGGPIV